MDALSPLERFSRRRFVNAGAAALVFRTALARAQKVPPNAPLPPDNAAQIAAGRDFANHLTIDVTLNDKGPFRFVVDTGADRSVVADDVAGRLGLVRQRQVMVEGVVRTIPAQTVTLSSMSFGQVNREDLEVPVLPRALLDADGYLGLDAIDGYRVTFDFKNRTLTVAQPRYSSFIGWSSPSGTNVSVVGKSGHLRSTAGRADGIPATTFIDTGAEVSCGNEKLLQALMEVSPTYARPEVVPLTGVTGGVIQGHITTIKRFHLPGLTLEGCNIVIANMQIFDLWDLRDTPALLIGMNFLRQFSEVSIDYRRKELQFEIARLVFAART